MPHIQVQTSPGETSENLRRVADVLGAAAVNIEGIGPAFQSPHIRTVFGHPEELDPEEGEGEEFEAGWNALDAAGLKPTKHRAVYVTLGNSPGKLRIALEHLARRGCSIESILVLTTQDEEGKVRLSIGIGDCIPDGWLTESNAISEAIETEAGEES
jgi:hypothetical protein